MSSGIRRQCAYGLAAGLVAVLSISVGHAQKSDPMNGVWKLDVAKSKFSPAPGPKSLTATIDTTGDSRKVSVEGASGDGTAVKWGYAGTFDGKEIKVTGTNPDADVIILKRLSPTSTETTYKKGGKTTIVNVLTVSADGRTLTVSTTGTNAQGQKVNHTQVLEKQKGTGT
jgi:hypothetical protein